MGAVQSELGSTWALFFTLFHSAASEGGLLVSAPRLFASRGTAEVFMAFNCFKCLYPI